MKLVLGKRCVRWLVKRLRRENKGSRVSNEDDDDQHIEDKDEPILLKVRIAKALGDLSPSYAVEPLVELLAHRKSAVRQEAAQMLVKMKDPASVLLIIALLDSKRSAYVRTDAAVVLGEIGDVRAVDALCRATRDRSVRLRRAAVDSLGKITSQNRDQEVLNSVVFALLERFRDDEDERVLIRACGVVGELFLDSPYETEQVLRVVDYLDQLLTRKSLSHEICRAVVAAMRQIGVNSVVAPLGRAARHENSIVANEAQAALEHLALHPNAAPEARLSAQRELNLLD